MTSVTTYGMIIPMSTSRTIKKRRDDLAMTQEDLAVAAGVSVATIRNIEKDAPGKRRHSLKPVLDTLDRLEGGGPALHGVDLDELARFLGGRQVKEVRVVRTGDGGTTVTLVAPGVSDVDIASDTTTHSE